ncbi:MAG: HPr family phosphocarrier protein [Planctomycetota bacterium]
MSERCTIEVTIINTLGLHARPAMEFADIAGGYQSSVSVKKDGIDPIDGKSIMHIMLLAATKGTALEITAEGPDAEACCAALKALVEAGFNED